MRAGSCSAGEQRLHLAAQTGRPGWWCRSPSSQHKWLPLCHRTAQPDMVRQPRGRPPMRRERDAGSSFAPDGVAPSPSSRSLHPQVALGQPRRRRSRHWSRRWPRPGSATLATERPTLQAHEVPALVQREVAAAGVGVGVVPSETVSDVLAPPSTLIHTPTSVCHGDGAPVIRRGDHRPCLAPSTFGDAW